MTFQYFKTITVLGKNSKLHWLDPFFVNFILSIVFNGSYVNLTYMQECLFFYFVF